MFDEERKSGRTAGLLCGRRRRLLFLTIAFFAAVMVDARSDVRIDRTDSGIIDVTISGRVSEQDAKNLEELSPELQTRALRVELNSEGGDVFAAMRIGRFIRKHEGKTILFRKCYSSCALIFIAGVVRINGGSELGLHRPYLASAPKSRQVIEEQVPVMLSLIKKYVAEMGITDNFYQQMVNTEPSQMVIYKWDSTKLVPSYDPVYQEVSISYRARQYGVTTAEMRRRESDVDNKCYIIGMRSYPCSEAMLWGLSESVYLERAEKAMACIHDQDRKILDTVARKDRRDHPLWIKTETCFRNIMLER